MSVKVSIAHEVKVQNSEHDWFVGQVVNATKDIETSEGIFIPVSAVVSTGEKSPYVVISIDDKATMKEVTVGKLFDNKIEVVSGLQEGDKVVVKGTDRLLDGDSINNVGGGSK